ncbi:Isobutyryl-CoA dehydrogenase, mitochondrial [Coccomyxa sp. Obi]|nr:Isobutyryl-CoA dehydrogenase, mitochondrial [Coccomyxa sp. Obi]
MLHRSLISGVLRQLPQARGFASSYIASQSFQVDNSLSEEQLEFQRTAREFAAKELLPNAAKWDAEKHFPVETLRKAAELGFASIYISDDVGGTGLMRSDAAIIFEALAYGDISTTAYLTIHNMVSGCIDRYGTDAQRQQFLPQLVSLQAFSSYCLTEPGSGSDAASLSTTAKRDGSDYILTGSKAFISGGGVADLYLVMARTGAPGPKGISAFLVEKGTPGLSFGKQEAKMGWNAQPTCSVSLDGVRVPQENRLGEEGQGFSIAMNALDGGRINIGTCSVGGAAFCLDKALQYASERRQFGQPISQFQAIQFKLADMATAVHAARLLVRRAAESLDAGAESATMDAAMAKRFATDACFSVADDAVQVLGGYGYLKEYGVERVMRDLRVHRILEGTNQIMNVIIARELGKQQC